MNNIAARSDDGYKQAIYAIQHLVKQYPGQTQSANDDITLHIHQGEIFGILGDNGAGKSTLVKQMVNLLRPTSGEIMLLGQPLTYNPMHVPMQVGYMPQDSAALNHLTVGEALYFTAHLRGMNRPDARQERDRQLAFWQIEALRNLPSSHLSGGQRRLMRLAVATTALPPILMLDEPTNDLDPQRRKLVWDNLREINRTHNTTIIFITHDAIEAEKVIQRVGIMREGKLVVNGRPSDLKKQVDQKLRLELLFSPEIPPQLPEHLPRHEIQAGHWLALLEWDEVTAVLNALDLTHIDDFRLYSATLEDLYLHYAT
ncbi:MAG: ABC transporter ATP-binding protein [Anaerolineales bacterium]|nr:ABC transporter ATP-binding protein [Anaerolineales bacterium]MCA9929357.1 ABC transporter ATP-binding protein [Anaerolineales bacterium]